VSEVREFRPRRRACIFCAEPFTDRMEDWLGEPAGCACCDGALPGHWPIKTQAPAPRPKPTEDLACDHCGKVLYLKP
jgi:hypothetical protein